MRISSLLGRLCVAFALASPLPVLAQSPANLIADSLTVTPEGVLIARGNVEAFQEGAALSAKEIRYDPDADRLEITGPILYRAADGTVIAATAADMDSGFRNGLLEGARLVLGEHLQLAAGNMARTEGYNEMRKVVATSCAVCGTQSPLWQIRASRVVHDETAQQIYFENAQVLVKGLPVFWLPNLRLPEPGLERARGFLSPRLRSTSRFGFGLMTPYFIPLGSSRDLTLTPYLFAENGALEARYRQAFRSGSITTNALFALPSDRHDAQRGYINATGDFALAQNRTLTFKGILVSDDAVLRDYDISSDDRLESEALLRQQRQHSLAWVRLSAFESLRGAEDNDTLPPFSAHLRYERDFVLPQEAGHLTLAGGLSVLWRNDDVEDASHLVHDLTRLSGLAHWSWSDILPHGFELETEAMARALTYAISSDSLPQNTQQWQNGAAVTLSWPLVRHTETYRDLLTPTLSLGWSGISGDAVPNEDSLVAELDSSNLHALSRLPGEDAFETGWRLSYGLNWTRQWHSGTSLALALGQIRRADSLEDLPLSSGLQGQSSDILLGAELDLSNGFGLDLRSLIANDFERIGKSELRFDWSNTTLGFSASYLHLPFDPIENRAEALSQWLVNGHYRVTPQWHLTGGSRYDLVGDQPIESTFGVTWQNECLELGFDLKREHATNHVLSPSTSFDFSINLVGFTTGNSTGRVSASCRS